MKRMTWVLLLVAAAAAGFYAPASVIMADEDEPVGEEAPAPAPAPAPVKPDATAEKEKEPQPKVPPNAVLEAPGTAQAPVAKKEEPRPAEPEASAPPVVPEAAPVEAKEAKEAKGKKGDKLEPVKPAALTPVAADKTGRPLHDRIVDFERVLCAGQKQFEVAADVKHDYQACGGTAAELETYAKRIKAVHDDRLRFLGEKFHRDLELLVLNTGRLSAATAEHRRADIFLYWQNVLRLRERLIAGGGWK